MIVQNSASVVYDPLVVVFDVVMRGGNGQQQKEISTGTWNPDHEITPLVLSPFLQVQDPSHMIADGDYSSSLINIRWFLDSESKRIVSDDKNKISDQGVLSWGTNTEQGVNHSIICVAQFIDPRRNEVMTFRKIIAVGCNSVNDAMLTLVIDAPAKCPIYPFKSDYVRTITATMYNGSDVVEGAEVKWFLSEENAFAGSDVLDPRFKQITSDYIKIDTRFVGRLLLECRATHPVTGEIAYARTKLFRWYGQYLERLDIPRGKALIEGSENVDLEVVVSNNRLGNIENPEQYFDITLCWKKNLPGEEWKVLGYGSKKTVPVSDINPKYGVDTVFGAQVRELSELRPLKIGDDFVKVNGEISYIRVPKIASDI